MHVICSVYIYFLMYNMFSVLCILNNVLYVLCNDVITWKILITRLLGRRSHSLSQHTQFLKNNMIAENDFLWNFDTIKRNQHARIWLASLARVSRSQKFFEKKKCVSIDSKCSETRKNAKKKKKKFTPLTHYALHAKRKVHENFRKKKYVSIDSKCSETHRNAKKKFYPYDQFRAERRSAKPERRSATLPTPCHPQGPKECPCQVSCRLD